MTEQVGYVYDVFISYSLADRDWVEAELLPRLEQAGVRVAIDYRDFIVGKPLIENIEAAVDASRRTIVVLSPEWVASEWNAFEALLIRTQDPAVTRRKLLPLRIRRVRPACRAGEAQAGRGRPDRRALQGGAAQAPGARCRGCGASAVAVARARPGRVAAVAAAVSAGGAMGGGGGSGWMARSRVTGAVVSISAQAGMGSRIIPSAIRQSPAQHRYDVAGRR